jgi:phosphoribosyl-dephospho-CoA transferase
MPSFSDTASSRIGRHDLVWIRPESRAAVAAQVAEEKLRAHVASWLAADRPLVVARQPDNIDADTIAVGLASTPVQGKRRIALGVSAHDIVRHTPPLLLADTIAHAPAEWQPELAELHDSAISIGIKLHVFGSLAWQALSGMQYVTPQSDIDLLWHPQSNTQLQQGIELLTNWEQASGLRADGEVLFGAGSAVSWREWAAMECDDDQRVLVKRERSAGLVAARELLELLA